MAPLEAELSTQAVDPPPSLLVRPRLRPIPNSQLAPEEPLSSPAVMLEAQTMSGPSAPDAPPSLSDKHKDDNGLRGGGYGDVFIVK